MGSVPKPRKPGQTGGGGRIGHTQSRVSSSNRGGRPHAGGGGGGKKGGGGCAVVAFGALGALAALGYGTYEAVRAVL